MRIFLHQISTSSLLNYFSKRLEQWMNLVLFRVRFAWRPHKTTPPFFEKKMCVGGGGDSPQPLEGLGVNPLVKIHFDILLFNALDLFFFLGGEILT